MAKSRNSKFFNLLKSIFLSTKGFPLALTLTLTLIFIVLFRMKSIEQDYSYNKITKQVKTSQNFQKELKAKKAKLLSIDNLKKIARRYKLKEPSKKQVIIIP